MSPFSTKIGYIGDKVLDRDLVLPGEGWPTIPPDIVAFLFSNDPKMGKNRGGSFKLLC